MQNAFSRVFSLNPTTEKEFYFVPEKSGNSLQSLVHINRDFELKKFTMQSVGDAKISSLVSIEI